MTTLAELLGGKYGYLISSALPDLGTLMYDGADSNLQFKAILTLPEVVATIEDYYHLPITGDVQQLFNNYYQGVVNFIHLRINQLRTVLLQPQLEHRSMAMTRDNLRQQLMELVDIATIIIQWMHKFTDTTLHQMTTAICKIFTLLEYRYVYPYRLDEIWTNGHRIQSDRLGKLNYQLRDLDALCYQSMPPLIIDDFNFRFSERLGQAPDTNLPPQQVWMFPDFGCVFKLFMTTVEAASDFRIACQAAISDYKLADFLYHIYWGSEKSFDPDAHSGRGIYFKTIVGISRSGRYVNRLLEHINSYTRPGYIVSLCQSEDGIVIYRPHPNCFGQQCSCGRMMYTRRQLDFQFNPDSSIGPMLYLSRTHHGRDPVPLDVDLDTPVEITFQDGRYVEVD